MENTEKSGFSNIQIPLLLVKSDGESDKDSIPFADSPESPPKAESTQKTTTDQPLHDGIILLITSDAEGQKSPSGSMKQHPLSDLFLLPTMDHSESGSHRRHSLRDRNEKKRHYSPERKKSCPDAELQLKVDRRRRSRASLTPRSEQDISTVCRDRLTPTSFYSNGSRRSSTCSLAQQRRPSTSSMSHKRRSSGCSVTHSRRSSNCSMTQQSRRSSNCSMCHSRRSSNCSGSHSRRSSNCSRRSSHVDSDEESFLRHHHHHHHHRGSRVSIDHHDMPQKYHRSPSTASAMSHDHRRTSRMSSPIEKRTSDEDLEAGEIPASHRRIVIIFIGSVSIFILLMSVILIAVSLTMSPTIDDLVRKENEEMYRAMSNLPSSAPVVPEVPATTNDTGTATGHPG